MRGGWVDTRHLWTPRNRLAGMNDRVTERPIPEARGPHLPDVLTRQSVWVFVFGLVAVFILWSVWRRWTAQYPIVDLNAVSALLFGLIPGVVAPLFGVALFARHPDARRTVPLLVFGVALFAFAELLEVFDGAIFEALIAFTPDAVSPATPAVVAFGVFTALLGMFAALYTGAGLSSARRQERSAAERPLMIWLVALGVVSAIVSIASIVPLLSGTPAPADLLQLAISFVVSLLVTLAWAYLVTVTVGGWLSGDVPRRAWALAGIATTLLFAVRLAIGAVLGTGEPWITIVNLASYASLVAWVLLLVAFWLGLPSSRAPVADTSADEPTVDPQEATLPGSAAG
jgi:hypothetical protein